MSDLPLPPEAVEAAAREVYRDPTRNSRVTAEATIHAFLDAMGVTVEDAGPNWINRVRGVTRWHRFVSAWFPVKDNTSKEAAR